MDLRQIEYFLAIVEHGGVRRAASALHVAQPSLSQSLRRLEGDLGTELFHRVGRGLVLAPAGEALIGPARRLLRDAHAAREAVRAVRALRGGRVDVAALSDLSTDPLSTWVARFRVDNPGVGVRVEEGDRTNRVIEAVKSGRCELGVVAGPRTPDGLIHRTVATQHLLLIHPPGTAGEFGAIAALTDLARIPLVMGPRDTTTREWVESALRAAGVEPAIAVEVPPRGAVVPMVLSGAGAALVSVRTGLEARQRGAAATELVPPVRRELDMVHRPGAPTAAAAAFIDFTHLQTASWERAVARRVGSGMSLIEASAATEAEVDRRRLDRFRRRSPLTPSADPVTER